MYVTMNDLSSYPTLRYGNQIAAALRAAPRGVGSHGDVAAGSLVSAISQASRHNRAGVDSNIRRVRSSIAAIRRVSGGAPLADILQRELQNVLRVTRQHLSRTAEEQEQYEVGRRGAEESWSRYRGYSDRAPTDEEIVAGWGSTALRRAGEGARGVGGAITGGITTVFGEAAGGAWEAIPTWAKVTGVVGAAGIAFVGIGIVFRPYAALAAGTRRNKKRR